MRNWMVGLVALSVGCVVVRGSGQLATEDRVVPFFESVEARDGVQVDLVVDPQLQGDVTLEVSTDDNLLDHLITEVRGGTLVVTTQGSMSTQLGLLVQGDVPSLTSVGAHDGATLTVKNLAGERLSVATTDGASATLSGDVSSLHVDARDGGSLNADGLTAQTADVSVQDGAHAEICVSGRVTGKVSDGGHLTVSCGGDASAVQVSDGGSVND